MVKQLLRRMQLTRNGYLLVALFYSLFLSFAAGQDLNIYGKFSPSVAPIDDQEIDGVYGSCFQGMNLVTCSPQLPEDDFALAYELDYYKSLGGVTGQFYCLKCCGQPPNHIDTWDMYCTVSDAINNGVNVFGYELRLARKRNAADRGVITCPLRRSACEYDENGNTIACRPFEKFTYLTGYTLTVWVNQYNKDFKYWKGVTKCEIESQESNFSLVPPEMFREKIILIHTPLDSAQWDNFKVLIVLIFIIFVAYGFLYFNRKSHCMYCQQKLVFCVRLCYKCRIVGAELPDPDLIKVLEEKGQAVQGEPPDNVFSLKTLSEFFHDRVMGVLCCGFYYACYFCCFAGGKNHARTLTKAVSQSIQVVPISSMPPRVEDYGTKPSTAKTVIVDEERGLDGTVSLKHTKKKREKDGDASITSSSLSTSYFYHPSSLFFSISSDANTATATAPAQSSPTSPSGKKASSPTSKSVKGSVTSPTGKKVAPVTPIDPTIAKKRQWWEKIFRKQLNPNLLPYERDIIEVVARHPKKPDEAETIIQVLRTKETEHKLLYESIYHPYDPRALLHRSIKNAHEDNGPIQAAATLGKGV